MPVPRREFVSAVWRIRASAGLRLAFRAMPADDIAEFPPLHISPYFSTAFRL
jgi:hypothetical protein